VHNKLEKWSRWLDVIHDDLEKQAAYRLVYRETMAIVDGTPDIPEEPDPSTAYSNSWRRRTCGFSSVP
jgi:hypothetical protein